MFAVVSIPDFALQSVLRHESDLWARPVGLIDDVVKKAAIFQLTAAARDSGICEGLTSTQALARCGNVVIKSRSLAQEQIAHEILWQTAYSFSPVIEGTADGICTMDLRGLSLFREAAPLNEAAINEWAGKIIAALCQSHLRARVGIGKTPTVAWYAAHYAKPFLLVTDSADFIGGLPVENLNPSSQILAVLQRWGIRTVGAFTNLGRDSIAERLGPEGLELFERVAVDEIRPLHAITPSESFFEAMEFEVEIESLQPLLFVLRRFVEQLSNRIGVRHLVIGDMELQLQLASGDTYKSQLKVPAPTGNINVLFRMWETHLETVRTDSSIISLKLSATPCRSENYQFGLFEAALRDVNQFSETLARLTALCGSENVGTPMLIETHRPDAFKMTTPDFERTSTPNDATRQSFGLKLRRFRPAFPADVELRNGVPFFVSSLLTNSAVEKSSGPWRSSGDWWEQEKVWNRDEWDVQTSEGVLYRIYNENNDWFIEGIYD